MREAWVRSARQCDRSDAQALFVPCEREDERLARRVGSPVLQAMARLMCDVDMTEQAELWRLECGEPSPRARATCVAPAWAPCSPSEAHAGAEARTEAMVDAQAAAALGVGYAGTVPAVTLVMPASVHSPAAVASAPSAAPQRNSTVEAARARVRGPTMTEQRLRAAEDAAKADVARRIAWKARASSARPASEQDAAPASVSSGKCVKSGMVLARAKLHESSDGVVAARDRRNALIGKGEFRDAEKVAREGSVGTLSRPPKMSQGKDLEEHKQEFGTWMRRTLAGKVCRTHTVASSHDLL